MIRFTPKQLKIISLDSKYAIKFIEEKIDSRKLIEFLNEYYQERRDLEEREKEISISSVLGMAI